jgi:ATP synthase protein I
VLAARANDAAAASPISTASTVVWRFIVINHFVSHFRRILDRHDRRQYVARALLGQVDFTSISSDGFFRRAVCAPFASDKARKRPSVRTISCEGPMAERDEDEEEDRLLRARLERLSGALDKRRKEAPPRPDAADGGQSSGSAMGLGLRAASEFAAAIVVGGLIGWQLDVWLGTKPAFLIVFFMLGVAAGVWNVIRVTSPMPRSEPTKHGQAAPPPVEQKAPPGADEDED